MPMALTPEFLSAMRNVCLLPLGAVTLLFPVTSVLRIITCAIDAVK